ncbi:hypothetical protein EMN47_13425 [Prolixibacteraceae bacterium JC049]|nr:hypothetical protein [Prolixibacteraceae bacterium JC049]
MKLYGGYVNLGDSINLIRNKDTSKSINISFEIRSKELKGRFGNGLINDFVENFTSPTKYLPLKAFQNIRNKGIDSVEDLTEYIDVYINLFKKEETVKQYIDEVRWFLENRSFINFGEINKQTKSEIIDSFNFLKTLSKLIKTETFNISVSISHSDNRFYIKEMCLSHKDKNILKLENSNSFSLTSDLIKFNSRNIEEIKNSFNPYNTIFSAFSFIHFDKSKSPLTSVISNILNISL